jgi:RNA polymerase sigma-70 factor (ECF subfamily)
MSNAEIIVSFRARTEEAILETQKKYDKLCRHVVGNVLSCPEDIDEVMNDTYHALWNSSLPESPEDLSPYLCKIAKNLALKKLRYNTTQKRNSNMSVPLDDTDYSATGDFVTALEGKETAQYINDFLQKAKFTDRNIFLRKYFVGDSIEQIAVTFGFSQSKVKSSLHRTRNKLREYLIKKGIEP